MSLENRIAQWVDLGITDYAETFELQKDLVEQRKLGMIPDTILFGEHYPVIDFGSSQTHNKFSPELISQFGHHGAIVEHLNNLGIGFTQTSRGGGSTFIGPGQLMVYPIVHHPSITGMPLNVSRYKSKIDSIMHDTLTKIGIKDARIVTPCEKLADSDMRKDRKDVWVIKEGKNYKLGGKGTHISGEIAYHGFNLYVTPECIDGFNYIQACGYTKEELDTTTISHQLGRSVLLDEVRPIVLDSIKREFGYSQIVPGKVARGVPQYA